MLICQWLEGQKKLKVNMVISEKLDKILLKMQGNNVFDLNLASSDEG